MADIIIYQPPIEYSIMSIEVVEERRLLDRIDELIMEEPTVVDRHDPSILPALPYGPMTQRELAIHLHATSVGCQRGHELTHEEWKEYHGDWYLTTWTYWQRRERNAVKRIKAENKMMRRRIRELEAWQTAWGLRLAFASSFLCGVTVGLLGGYFIDYLSLE